MRRKSTSGSAIADDIATPDEVAEVLHTTADALAQMRYRGTGPKFIKRGHRVLYRTLATPTSCTQPVEPVSPPWSKGRNSCGLMA